MITLRDYQRDCLDAIFKGYAEFDRQLVVLPTGAGKTICFAAAALRTWQESGQRTLILAHREELIQQAVSKIRFVTGLEASIEKAESRASRTAPIVVASVQTMQGARLESWAADHFGLVVADEAHHAISASWQNTLRHFHGHAKVLGVTATPGRGDKKNLGQYFQNIAYEIGLLDLVNRGYLSPIVIQTLPLKIDLAGVQSAAGDYDAAALAAAIEPLLRQVIGEIKRVASDRKTLVFLPLIKTSKRFVELCWEEGLEAGHVDGEMENRKDVLDRFARNEFQILSNAMLLMEGYDQPDIDCVAMLRPTRSTALYAQAVGRGTRLANQKKNLLLLDFLWLHERHNLIRPAHLIATSDDEARTITRLSADNSDEQLDLMELRSLSLSEREAALVREMAEKAKRRSSTLRLEEVAIALHDPELADFEPSMEWQERPPTQRQIEVLGRFKIPAEQIKNKGHASFLISRFFSKDRSNLASPNQVVWLMRLNHPSPHTATRAQASKFLNSRFRNKAAKAAPAVS